MLSVDLVVWRLNSLSYYNRRDVGSVLLALEMSPISLQISHFPSASLSNGMGNPQSRQKYTPLHSSAKQTKLYQVHVVSFLKPVQTCFKGTWQQERMDSGHLASGGAQSAGPGLAALCCSLTG